MWWWCEVELKLSSSNRNCEAKVFFANMRHFSFVFILSGDGKMFKVDMEVASYSQVIKDRLVDTTDDDNVITLHKVHGVSLEKVLEWCSRQHEKDRAAEDGVKLEEEEEETEDGCAKNIGKWDREFLERIDEDGGTQLLGLVVLAANLLNVPGLIELLSRKAKLQSALGMFQQLQVENDFHEN